jgi:hypothetical protein
LLAAPAIQPFLNHLWIPQHTVDPQHTMEL